MPFPKVLSSQSQTAPDSADDSAHRWADSSAELWGNVKVLEMVLSMAPDSAGRSAHRWAGLLVYPLENP